DRWDARRLVITVAWRGQHPDSRDEGTLHTVLVRWVTPVRPERRRIWSLADPARRSGASRDHQRHGLGPLWRRGPRWRCEPDFPAARCPITGIPVEPVVSR